MQELTIRNMNFTYFFDNTKEADFPADKSFTK